MAERTTLNAKLKILIARTFRAEKLYSSMRNIGLSRGANLANVIEISNDIRVKEWQGCHAQLRAALSDLLSLGNTKVSIQRIEELRRDFQNKAIESASALGKKTEQLLDSVKRQEFSNVLKLSFELIGDKARAQANKALVDELSALAPLSYKHQPLIQAPLSDRVVASLQGVERKAGSPQIGLERAARTGHVPSLGIPSLPQISNVIPLKRRASFNSGY